MRPRARNAGGGSDRRSRRETITASYAGPRACTFFGLCIKSRRGARLIGLTIASPKGGVGKTTVALNLGFSLARRGWRTLVVDTDPQGAIGLSLSKQISKAPGLAEYANRLAPIGKLAVQTKLRELMLLPVGRVAAEDTMGFNAALADGAVLKTLVKDMGTRTDVVLFDTPSGFGGSTMGALRASSRALCLVQAEPIAARSVLRIFEVIAALQEQGAEVQLAGFLLTMLQTRDSSSLSVAEEMWKNLPSHLVLDVTIPRDPVFLQASAAGVPVGLLRRRPPPVSMVFDQLAADLETKLSLANKDGNDAPISLVD